MQGGLQPLEYLVLCVLHRNHAAPLNMRDAAGKEGLKNLRT